MSKRVLAFDFGASGGRAMLGSYDGERIKLTEIHRFANEPVLLGGTLYWDTLRLFHEIKQGILKAKNSGGFDSIGINSWGVDFGLLDDEGRLLESSIHYRDKRTEGMLDECFKKIDSQQLYMETGNQIMAINTAFQLLSLKSKRESFYKRAETMLLTPDLFNYFLTDRKVSEYSIASTTQLCNPFTRDWNDEVIKTLGLDKGIFPKIVEPGTVIGELSENICDELGVDSCPVIAVCGHDTQCAVAATPTDEEDFVFISCGTWSLVGTELDTPIVSEKSAELNLTNEGGFNATTNFLKNIIGLWIIQESRRQWIRDGEEYSYAELEKRALNAAPFKCFIDPDSEEFVSVGNIPKRVQEFCKKTEQYIPQTVGEIIRCVYESLVLKYRLAYEQICECTDKAYEVIHILGGGTKDGLLCQMTANACDKKVVAGPIEATVYGNVAIQLIAGGEIESMAQAREIIAKSENLKIYNPSNSESWKEPFERFKKVVKY